MNEKPKAYMQEQSQKIYDQLNQHFKLPIFQDEVGENEIPSDYHFFLLVYGDIQSTKNDVLLQDVYIIYTSQNNAAVDQDVLDIISLINPVKGVSFNRTIKQRLEIKETDDYLDEVTVHFRRKLSYEHQLQS
ncbi:hypothetical protein [Piscibacillus salipiscarius]|uniref:DUF3168 domain-containing protein n=1 Tax=Piscibacillus salipiscarius TaxID=299480 RepID=A0ABW5Q955_9BACI|nr:hypothetical protein [Piscibacillus salipiscarius]